MMTTVNLPTETINSIINIDDKNILIPIETAMAQLDPDKTIRSMCTIPNVVETAGNDNRVEKNVSFNHDVYYISKITKQPIINTNRLSYFEIVVKFYDEKEMKLILPGYVKLFSRSTKTFVPAEFIKKTDMLIDYKGYNVQVLSNTMVNFDATEFYNIQISSSNENYTTIYLNGILAYVYYNNFQKTVE